MRLRKLLPISLIFFILLALIFSTQYVEQAKATTVTYQVSSTTDDCWKAWSGTDWIFYTLRNDIGAGYWSASDYKQGSGMRFQNISVPQGATITSAYLQFYFGYYGMDLTNPYCNNKIRGEDTDTSLTFSTVTDFDDRNRTTTVVEWNNIASWYQGNWYNSPDISSIIQEVVNRTGWASGNNMTLFRDDFDDRSAHVDYTSRECHAYERGASTASRLVITYAGGADSGTYLYEIHGPYLETGNVFDGTVNMTLSYDAQEPDNYALDGTDLIADDLMIYSNQSAVSMFWNISSDYLYYRTYYFPNDTINEVYVYVPDITANITTQYNIAVIDFAGLTNAFIETTKNIGGYTRIIERRSLDVINSMPVWLISFTQYNLRVVSTQGTWTFTLPADSLTTKQFVITRDMITQTFQGTNVTITATRPNATYINVYFYDNLLQTSNITTQITHVSSSVAVEDFSQVDTTYTTNITWNDGAGDTDYNVEVTAFRDGENQTWTFALPIPSGTVAQFFLQYFDVFGIWPIPSYQLPAVFFCLLFFGIGSWRDSDVLSFIAIMICGIFQLIGWGSFPLAGIAMSVMVVVFAYLHRGKQETVILE